MLEIIVMALLFTMHVNEILDDASILKLLIRIKLRYHPCNCVWLEQEEICITII